MTAKHDETFAVALAIVVALCTVTGAILAGRPEPVASAPIDPACREYTDGCVTCRREASGPVCSNPGIACVRGPAVCLDPPAPPPAAR